MMARLYPFPKRFILFRNASLFEESSMSTQAQRFIDYLQANKLCLATAESCTAGTIIALLADIPGSGSLMDCGYVVYSEAAKKRLLDVKRETIERFTLTSEEVAREMAIGALRDSDANAAIATTGIVGSEPMDGIPPGTICFAWAFDLPNAQRKKQLSVFSETRRYQGERPELRNIAARHALERFAHFHQLALSAIK